MVPLQPPAAAAHAQVAAPLTPALPTSPPPLCAPPYFPSLEPPLHLPRAPIASLRPPLHGAPLRLRKHSSMPPPTSSPHLKPPALTAPSFQHPLLHLGPPPNLPTQPTVHSLPAPGPPPSFPSHPIPAPAAQLSPLHSHPIPDSFLQPPAPLHRPPPPPPRRPGLSFVLAQGRLDEAGGVGGHCRRIPNPLTDPAAPNALSSRLRSATRCPPRA